MDSNKSVQLKRKSIKEDTELKKLKLETLKKHVYFSLLKDISPIYS